jgi:hypothetical protein
MAMGLDYSSGGGDFLPIIKYDARAGRWYIVERELANGQWSSYTKEMGEPTFAMDLHDLEVGWINFTPVNFAMVGIGNPLPVKPTDKHKQGFRVRVYNKVIGVREFAHTAKCVLAAMDKLHDAFVAAGQPRTKLPVVKMTGTEMRETQSGQGTTRNYEPVLSIVDWIDRPEDWPERNAPAQQQASAAPETTSRHVDPPGHGAQTSAPQQQAQPATASGNLF